MVIMAFKVSLNCKENRVRCMKNTQDSKQNVQESTNPQSKCCIQIKRKCLRYGSHGIFCSFFSQLQSSSDDSSLIMSQIPTFPSLNNKVYYTTHQQIWPRDEAFTAVKHKLQVGHSFPFQNSLYKVQTKDSLIRKCLMQTSLETKKAGNINLIPHCHES